MKYLPLLLLLLFGTTHNNETNKDSFVLVQLFTSQGCSSCPPADRLVNKIKNEYKDQRVYVMSYHVDYWDRLGWKDPFSKNEFTQYQYSYATQFKERRVYTPQIVVNGKEHFVGSHETKLRNRITSYLKESSTNPIKVSRLKEKNTLKLTFEVTGDITDKKLVIASVLDNSITEVKRGENSNRTLLNSNIVLQTTKLELSKQKKANITVQLEKIKNIDKTSLMVFVQNKDLEISGATQVFLN